MRMLGPRGNPQARNLFEIVAYLQQAEGVRFEVRPARAALRNCRVILPRMTSQRYPFLFITMGVFGSLFGCSARTFGLIMVPYVLP